MLNKESVFWWNEVVHDLYEDDETGYTFDVELDLCNNHQSYYCRIEDHYIPIGNDIYDAIEKFNEITKV